MITLAHVKESRDLKKIHLDAKIGTTIQYVAKIQSETCKKWRFYLDFINEKLFSVIVIFYTFILQSEKINFT